MWLPKLDFEFPTNWANFNFGSKLSFIKNLSDVSFYDLTSGNQVYDTTKSNNFEYKENIQALYISGNKKLTNSLEVQLG